MWRRKLLGRDREMELVAVLLPGGAEDRAREDAVLRLGRA